MSKTNWWDRWEFEAWLTDPAVGRAPMAARGVWTELLNLMMKAKAYQIEGTVADLARLCRCHYHEMDLGLKDIERLKLGDVTRCNNTVTVVSRRRKREHDERENTRARVAKHRGIKPPSLSQSEPKKQPCNENVPSNYNSGSSGVVPGEGAGRGGEESVEGETPTDGKLICELALLAHGACAGGKVPSYPSSLVLANVRELGLMGRSEEDIRQLCEWRLKTELKHKPKSANSLTDPERFEQWQTMMQEDGHDGDHPDREF